MTRPELLKYVATLAEPLPSLLRIIEIHHYGIPDTLCEDYQVFADLLSVFTRRAESHLCDDNTQKA